MVGHSANELLEGKTRHCSSTLQALSQRLREIAAANRLLRADRLLLLARPAHVVQMSLSLPKGEAHRQQSSALRTPDETLEGSFDGIIAADLGTAEFVLGVDFLP